MEQIRQIPRVKALRLKTTENSVVLLFKLSLNFTKIKRKNHIHFFE